MADNQAWPEWLLESEAAEYCRCSLWSFRKMGAPAKNSGGRKVYRRLTLDEFINSREWEHSPRGGGAAVASRCVDLPANLTAVRLRPFVPRKGEPLDPLTPGRRRPYKPRKKAQPVDQ